MEKELERLTLERKARDTFTIDYGPDFQVKVIQMLLYDDSALINFYDILVADYFDRKALKELFKAICRYYEKYKKIPTLDVLKANASGIRIPALRQDVISTLSEIQTLPTRDLEYVRDNTEEFCINQKIVGAVFGSVEFINRREYSQARQLIESAFRSTLGNKLGHMYFEDIKDRMENLRRRVVPTGLGILDSLLNGGLGAGELGVIMAGSGVGKSMSLINIGFGGLSAGKNVIHYTFEDNYRLVGTRYDSRLTGIPINDIKKNQEDVEKQVTEFYKNHGSLLVIKDYSDETITVSNIKAHLDQLEFKNIRPDLLIFDYADYIAPIKKCNDELAELKSVYRDLRYLSKERNCGCWTACFHGDTIVHTPCGKNKIKDLVGQSGFPVYSYSHQKKCLELKTVKSVYKSGENQLLYRVKLDNGKEVVATLNHKFMLRDGSYKELRYLKPGDSLMPLYRRMKDNRKQIYLNDGKWENQYRLVAEWKYGGIPKYYQVHHIDCNKFNDHPDNIEMLTISEHYRKHAGKSSFWSYFPPASIERLKISYSGKMREKNPMFDPEVVEKMRKSKMGTCTGSDNWMTTVEGKKWWEENNCQFNKKSREKTRDNVKYIWFRRTEKEKKEIFDKAAITRFGSTKEVRIQQHIERAKFCKSMKEFIEKTKNIPLDTEEKRNVWRNYNCKVTLVEFYGYDDVYNMEVEDLHNYGLDAGIIVKNSQSNRAILQEELVTGEGVAGSYDKKRVADVFITLTRKMEDKFQNRAKLFLDKSRVGEDGKVIPATLETFRCFLQLHGDGSDATPVKIAEMFGAEKQEVFTNELRNKFGNDYANWKKSKTSETSENI